MGEKGSLLTIRNLGADDLSCGDTLKLSAGFGLVLANGQSVRSNVNTRFFIGGGT